MSGIGVAGVDQSIGNQAVKTGMTVGYEFPSDVADALAADGYLPRIAFKPGKFSRRGADSGTPPGRFKATDVKYNTFRICKGVIVGPFYGYDFAFTGDGPKAHFA